MGKDNSIKSLVSLAYDCRRADMFRGHLFDALRLIERGDLQPAEMLGSWAGELGQTQMMPSEYIKWAVDYDGDGKRNLLRSVPGRDRLDRELPREPRLEARRAVAAGGAGAGENCRGTRPTSPSSIRARQWAHWGVAQADGRPLQKRDLKASLLLPMGRFGPAFLAFDNFQAYLKWNTSLVYSTTAAYYATRLAGAPRDAARQRHPAAASPSSRPSELQELPDQVPAMTSAAPTASSALSSRPRSAPCRSSSACRPTPIRPSSSWRGCAPAGSAGVEVWRRSAAAQRRAWIVGIP